MRPQQNKSITIACECGKVRLSASYAPLLAASCYCSSCQQAGQEFENFPGAAQVLDDGGGTPFLLYRKDRVQCEAGKEHLQEFTLKPDSPTRRVIAACCHSPMFLDFTRGHWLSIYRRRVLGDAPPIEMRIMTKARRGDVVLDNTVPSYDGYPGKFMLKLLLAWVAMGFGKPDMELRDIPRFVRKG